jgi:glutamate-1-semialdehyde aminotransferase
MPHKTFLNFNNTDGISGNAIRTLFRQECFTRGVFLGYGHFICFSHTTEDIKRTIKISNEVLNLISNMIEDKKMKSILPIELARDVFKRY